jgi:hypothetical protein
MYSGRDTRALPRVGFPIRRSRDQRLVSTSPGLIAAAHVLHRLLAPRHPPCALVLLIEKNTCVATMEFSRCAPDAPAVLTKTARCPWGGLSKLSSMVDVEVDVIPGELEHRTAYGHRRVERLRSKSSGFPRKEVIQPQLPLRLPCYDFTPVTDPTFDGSLPCGLGHRLRVLPASVV